MAYNYVVTAQKPTNIGISITGNFTNPDEINLVISKSSRLEIHTVTPEGLVPQLDVPIYGTISSMEFFRPHGHSKDLIFILTERYQFCVLAYDESSGEIVTRAMGNAKDRIGKPTDNGKLGIISPSCSMIGMHLYDGLFKVIPMRPDGNLCEAFNIRLEELQVVDLQFLDSVDGRPLLAVLYQDAREARHVKTYVVNVNDKEFEQGPWGQSNVEASATLLIPVPQPLGGVLIVGLHTLTYHCGTSYKAIAIQDVSICAYGKVDADGSRFLLGDQFGGLHVVVLDQREGQVDNIHMEHVGVTSVASTISYLDNGVVFIGSSFGDSQLIKLNQEKDDSGSYVEVLETYMNLGPILDMVVTDLDKQGQGQVVTCSGNGKDGSLRVVRNGIGINEQASIELSGIKGMWSLRPTTNGAHDKYLVQSYINETRVLAIDGEEMEETTIAGFEPGTSLFCRNMIGDCIVQATERGVFLLDSMTLQRKNSWLPPEGLKITIVQGNLHQVVLACGGGHVFSLALEAGCALVEKAKVTMVHEVACINLNPLPFNAESQTEGGVEEMKLSEDPELQSEVLPNEPAVLVAIGLWNDVTVRLLALPDLQEVLCQPLGGDTQARSVMLHQFGNVAYLLAGLGDGHLISFILETSDMGPTLVSKKKVALGTQPIALSVFRNNGQNCVFAASDRPTVVYSSNEKLLFANVNVGEVTLAAPFHSELFPDCLALATEGNLIIGTIDDIQKLHVHTIPLGESPRRIVHHDSAHIFAVLVTRRLIAGIDDVQEDEEQSFVRFLDNTTFEEVYSHQLDPYENGMSLACCQFSGMERECLVVGTACVHDDEYEPTNGRILVFSVEGEGIASKVSLATEQETRGAVYCLNSFNGKLLAGINSKVQLYRWDSSDEGQLMSECGHHGHIVALFVCSRGDFIIMGDLMRSVSLLLYNPINSTIEEIARDFNSNWMTSIAMLDDDIYIGSEQENNIFTVRRNVDAATDEERGRLEVQGEFHLGELVNKFVHGSLVMQPAEAESPEGKKLIVQKPLLFGTVNGMIGVILTIPQESFTFFSQLQRALGRVINGVGGFVHEEYRSFYNSRTTSECKNFIDGDLIEMFLDLSREKMERVVQLMKDEAPGDIPIVSQIESDTELTVDYVCRFVEDMSRLH